jgi:hypothetical protein
MSKGCLVTRRQIRRKPFISGAAVIGVLTVFVVSGAAACSAPAPGPPEETERSERSARWDSLPDGGHSGFVREVEGDGITFSPATKISDTTQPNPFRIEREDVNDLRLRVSPSATVALIDNVNIDHHEVNVATLAAFFAGEGPSRTYGSPEYFFAEIETKGGEVLRIEEVYLP